MQSQLELAGNIKARRHCHCFTKHHKQSSFMLFFVAHSHIYTIYFQIGKCYAKQCLKHARAVPPPNSTVPAVSWRHLSVCGLVTTPHVVHTVFWVRAFRGHCINLYSNLRAFLNLSATNCRKGFVTAGADCGSDCGCDCDCVYGTDYADAFSRLSQWLLGKSLH